MNDNTWVSAGRFDKSGDYRFSAVLKTNGAAVYEETRKVAVAESKALEESLLDNDEAALKNIAADSGGKYFTRETFSPREIAAGLKAPVSREEKGENPLWDKPWLLALIAASMLLELLFRRRNGLL